MVVTAVVEVGRPLREGHGRGPLSGTAGCPRVGPRGRGGVGNTATLVPESPALVRRVFLGAVIFFRHLNIQGDPTARRFDLVLDIPLQLSDQIGNL